RGVAADAPDRIGRMQNDAPGLQHGCCGPYVCGEIHHKSSLMLISCAQRKCPCGQAGYPCSPHGLQYRSSTWTTRQLPESGPKPKQGCVEQYTAVTGASIAEAKCIGPESLV